MNAFNQIVDASIHYVHGIMFCFRSILHPSLWFMPEEADSWNTSLSFSCPLVSGEFSQLEAQEGDVGQEE